ncbi:MIT domain-containing protein 1-like [Stegodyphus dumicola]|uniref:MIT domain-containing protein 1-like n=1 Tax=Stegodyphus dumicola TaxID=202533 RepID=UPI0015B36327|nr:MIT domain-containing protein 1-like [Stegodyphus dumicola]
MDTKKQVKNSLNDKQNSAISVLRQAVEHDQEGNYVSALRCYREGIELFLSIINSPDNRTLDEKTLAHFRQKTKEYIERAEKIKKIIDERKHYHEQILIPNDATGYSYEKVFKKYLDKSVTEVHVEDPYVRTTHQIYNFLNFCELLVKFCSNLKHIYLVTGRNETDYQNQNSKFQNIKESLKSYNIQLSIEFSDTLHDREIRLDSGVFIKIGRGLDYFKHVKNFAIGFCDQSLRPCHETAIDIYVKHK